MIRYTISQRKKMVWFYAKTKSIKLTQQKFKEHFNISRAPQPHTLVSLFDKFLKTRSILDAPGRGRKKRGRSTAHVDQIRRAVLRSLFVFHNALCTI